MLKRCCVLTISIVLFTCSAALAQGAPGIRNLVPGPSHTKAITPVDRPEIKVQRVDIEPNATRGMHAHDDVIYHVFLATDAPLDLNIEGEGMVHLAPWEAHFFKGGTLHAITNPNATPARFIEIFVNTPKATAGAIDPAAAIAMAFAAAAK